MPSYYYTKFQKNPCVGRNERCPLKYSFDYLGPVVQSVVSLTSLLRVILLTLLVDSIHNILIFFAEKNGSSFCKKFQHICVSLDINFNESLTNNVVSFEQPGPGYCVSKTAG